MQAKEDDSLKKNFINISSIMCNLIIYNLLENSKLFLS